MWRLTAVAAYWFWPRAKLAADTRIDTIVVLKSKRMMYVYQHGKMIRSYRISLGSNPVGHKQFEGDGRTPEGHYTINGRNPESRFYKNLGISYPGPSDVEFAKSASKSPGGDIKIHGLRNGRGYRGTWHLLRDWTAGCIAVTNREMDELFQIVCDNARIEIRA